MRMLFLLKALIMKTRSIIYTGILMTLISCYSGKKEADLILFGGTVYTVDREFSKAEAIVVKDHRILEVGSSDKMLEKYTATEIRNLEGKFVYPGWIDAHCHFFGYGMNLNAVDVAGTSSVEEIIGMLKKFQETHPGSWITGRGWDQNDWEVKEFPDRLLLDKYFPDTPILLRRIDGHAAWVNTKALELAGVTARSKVDGGTVILKDGEPSGILVDNAIGLVDTFIPKATREEIVFALLQAELNCFSVGLTSVHDASIRCPEDPHQRLAESDRSKLLSLCGEGALPNRPPVGKYN